MPSTRRSRTRSRTPEGAIQGPGLTLLALRGYPVLRLNSGALRDRTGRLLFLIRDHTNRPWSGVSDCLSWSPVTGRILACEFKSPTGKPTPAQRAFLESVRDSGGIALLVSDLRMLDRALSALDADPWARLDLDGSVIS